MILTSSMVSCGGNSSSDGKVDMNGTWVLEFTSESGSGGLGGAYVQLFQKDDDSLTGIYGGPSSVGSDSKPVMSPTDPTKLLGNEILAGSIHAGSFGSNVAGMTPEQISKSGILSCTGTYNLQGYKGLCTMSKDGVSGKLNVALTKYIAK